MTQMVCESYAQEFNRRRTGVYIGFLPVSVLRLDRDGILYNSEPYLRGDYLKHNDNSGHVDTAETVPQAFSHFTYEASNQTLIVVDIQGVGDYYTDPQIHSFNGEGFGLGNLGGSGIKKFLQTHHCNRICRVLGLRDPRKSGQVKKESDEEMAKRLQEEELRGAPEYAHKCQWTSARYDDELSHLSSMIDGVMNQRKKQAAKNAARSPCPVIPQQQQRHHQQQQHQQNVQNPYQQPPPQRQNHGNKPSTDEPKWLNQEFEENKPFIFECLDSIENDENSQMKGILMEIVGEKRTLELIEWNKIRN